MLKSIIFINLIKLKLLYQKTLINLFSLLKKPYDNKLILWKLNYSEPYYQSLLKMITYKVKITTFVYYIKFKKKSVILVLLVRDIHWYDHQKDILSIIKVCNELILIRNMLQMVPDYCESVSAPTNIIIKASVTSTFRDVSNSIINIVCFGKR